MGEGEDVGPWWNRIAWLVAIWAMSLAVLGTVAMIIRFWLKG